METEKPPPIPSAKYQVRIKTRSDTESFLVCPVEMRNQLAMLLEIPSIPRLKTNHSYAQKALQNLELARETMKVPQLPKKSSKQFKMGMRVDTYRISQFSKIRKN